MHRLRLACASLLSVCVAVSGCNESSIDTPVAAGPTQATAALKPTNGPSDDELARIIDEAVALNGERYMTANEHCAWQIVHGILPYGRNLKIYVKGELVSALDYLLGGGELRGWAIKPGDHGVDTVLEVGSKVGQGHDDQWLGYISQTGISPDEPITVAGKQYKFIDLLTQAQWDAHEGMEAGWLLMAAAVYLPADSTWTARDGQQWSVERLIGMEAGADLAGAACGGSHSMSGIAMALNRKIEDGGPLTGGWAKAEEKVQECIRKAHEHQQPDGTFSTNYWIRPSTSPDAALRLNTTGHTLEYLTIACSDAQLREPWIRQSVVALCDLLDQTRELPVECGGLYHAIHGLDLYRLRMYGPRDGSTDADAPPAPAEAAQAPEQTQQR